MNFFKKIYGIIVKPKETLAEITKEASVWQGIIVLVLLSLLPLLVIFNRDTFISSLGPGMSPYSIDQVMAFMPIFMVFSIFTAMIISPVFHFVSTAIFHLLSGFFGHEGNGRGLFAGLAFASIPSLFSSIIYFISLSFNIVIISIVLNLAITAWIIVLKILAIRASYSMSGGKATLIYFIPTITIIVIIGIVIILSIISFIPIINSVGNSLGMPM